MRLRYLGTGTVVIEGFGEVSSGDVIGVRDDLGARLAEERPEQWQIAPVEPASAGVDEGKPAPRARARR